MPQYDSEFDHVFGTPRTATAGVDSEFDDVFGPTAPSVASPGPGNNSPLPTPIKGQRQTIQAPPQWGAGDDAGLYLNELGKQLPVVKNFLAPPALMTPTKSFPQPNASFFQDSNILQSTPVVGKYLPDFNTVQDFASRGGGAMLAGMAGGPLAAFASGGTDSVLSRGRNAYVEQLQKTGEEPTAAGARDALASAYTKKGNLGEGLVMGGIDAMTLGVGSKVVAPAIKAAMESGAALPLKRMLAPAVLGGFVGGATQQANTVAQMDPDQEAAYSKENGFLVPMLKEGAKGAALGGLMELAGAAPLIGKHIGGRKAAVDTATGTTKAQSTDLMGVPDTLDGADAPPQVEIAQQRDVNVGQPNTDAVFAPSQQVKVVGPDGKPTTVQVRNTSKRIGLNGIFDTTDPTPPKLNDAGIAEAAKAVVPEPVVKPIEEPRPLGLNPINRVPEVSVNAADLAVSSKTGLESPVETIAPSTGRPFMQSQPLQRPIAGEPDVIAPFTMSSQADVQEIPMTPLSVEEIVARKAGSKPVSPMAEVPAVEQVRAILPDDSGNPRLPLVKGSAPSADANVPITTVKGTTSAVSGIGVMKPLRVKPEQAMNMVSNFDASPDVMMNSLRASKAETVAEVKAWHLREYGEPISNATARNLRDEAYGMTGLPRIQQEDAKLGIAPRLKKNIEPSPVADNAKGKKLTIQGMRNQQGGFVDLNPLLNMVGMGKKPAQPKQSIGPNADMTESALPKQKYDDRVTGNAIPELVHMQGGLGGRTVAGLGGKETILGGLVHKVMAGAARYNERMSNSQSVLKIMENVHESQTGTKIPETQRPSALGSLSRRGESMTQDAIVNGLMDFDTGVRDPRTALASKMEAMLGDKGVYDAADRYVKTRRAIELREKQGKMTGLKSFDAMSVDQLKAATSEFEKAYPEMAQIGANQREFGAGVLDFMKKTHLTDQAGYDGMKATGADWVHIVRSAIEPDGTFSPGFVEKSGQNLNWAKVAHELKGTDKDGSIHFMEANIDAIHRLQQAAIKNRAANAVAGITLTSPGVFDKLAKVWNKVPPKEAGTPVVYRNTAGKVRWLTADKDILNAFTDMGPMAKDPPTALMKWFLRPTEQAFRYGVTMNPAYFIGNLAKDMVQQSIITPGYSRLPGHDHAVGAYHLVMAAMGDPASRKIISDFKGYGGAQSLELLQSSMLHNDPAAFLIGTMPMKDALKMAKNAKHAATLLGRSMDQLLSAGETAGRLGQFLNIAEHGEKVLGLSPHEAKSRGGVESARLMDFSQRGGSRTARFFKQRTAFVGAAMASVSRESEWFMKAMSEPKYALRATAFVTFCAALALRNKDNPRIQNQTDDHKRAYWDIDTTDGKGKGREGIISIPKPPGLMTDILANMAQHLVDMNDGHHSQYALNASRQGIAESLAQDIIPLRAPVGLRAPFEAITGYKFPTMQPVVPRSLADKLPQDQYDGGTSQFAVDMGKKLGRSPMAMDNWMKTLNPMLRPTLMDAYEQLAHDPKRGESRTSGFLTNTKQQLVGRFIGDENDLGFESLQLFNDKYQELNQANNSLTQLHSKVPGSDIGKFRVADMYKQKINLFMKMARDAKTQQQRYNYTEQAANLAKQANQIILK